MLLPSNSDKTMAPASAPVNAVNDAGNTPLHWAALNGHLDCVKLLVQCGADVTIINRAGHDAVFEAEINDKKEVVDWLLGAVEELEKGIGSNGEFRASYGMTKENRMEVEDAAQGSSSNTHEASSNAVEGVRKQVEDLNTNDGLSQGG
jgi:ankyrin repeat protein